MIRRQSCATTDQYSIQQHFKPFVWILCISVLTKNRSLNGRLMMNMSNKPQMSFNVIIVFVITHAHTCQYRPDGSMAAVTDVAHHWCRGHFFAQVVMGVHCQPEIPINKSYKGQRLSPGSHLQLLKMKGDEGQERKSHTKYKYTNTAAQIKCISSWYSGTLSWPSSCCPVCRWWQLSFLWLRRGWSHGSRRTPPILHSPLFSCRFASSHQPCSSLTWACP